VLGLDRPGQPSSNSAEQAPNGDAPPAEESTPEPERQAA
jgi:hypothetical protein